MDSFYTHLISAYEFMNQRVTICDTLEHIFKTFKELIPYNRIGIVLIDYNGKFYCNSAFTDGKKVLMEGYAKSPEETSLKKVVAEKIPRIINDYKAYYNENPESETTKMLLEEGMQSSIAYPLVSSDETIGVVIFSSYSPHAFSTEHIKQVKMISNYIAISLEKNIFVDDLVLASITGFAKLVEAKDNQTGLHLERMQNYSYIIAKKLSSFSKYKQIIDESFINDIYKFSPIHDIGKVGIADGILLKPGKLTTEEFEVMKQHTIIGAEVLKKSINNLMRKGRHFFDIGIEITLSHHERYNGKGYPYGLSGTNIPLSARIVIAADVLDALTSKRVYKAAFDLDYSFQYLKDESGQMFDPDIVSAVMDSKEEILEIYNKYNENIDLSNI